MKTRTRFTQRIALVAVLALVLALAPAGGLGSASATGGPGQSNHCPDGTEQVRFERAGAKDGFTVTAPWEYLGYRWYWTYAGDDVVAHIYAFGGNTLREVPGAEGTTSGTISATALNLRNWGGQLAQISHVDFCMVQPEPETYEVIAAKDWVYLLDGVELTGDDVPAGAQAVVTIGADEDLVKSWTFDGAGAFVGDDTPLVLPVQAVMLYHSEVVTAPEGYTCEGEFEEVVVDGLTESVVYTNICSRTTPTFEVIAAKEWTFLLNGVELTGDDIPAGAEAVVTIDAGEHGTESWTFDSSGAFVGNDEPMVLPEGAPFIDDEEATAPDGYTCEPGWASFIERGGRLTVTYFNTCSRTTRSTPTTPTTPTVPDRTPDEVLTDEPEEAVEGIDEEAPTTTVDEAVKGIEEVEALPRTGGETTGTTLVAIAALLSGAALLAAVRRRQLVS